MVSGKCQLDDAQDSLHNVDKAKTKFEAAKKTLQADGVQFPIHLDIPVSSLSVQNFMRQVNLINNPSRKPLSR